MELRPETIGKIRHPSTIFSIALSRDERLLACGGIDSEPVTVWSLEDGACVARLNGLKRQAHALAFSPDGTRLAAANLWGAQCVWRLDDGALIDERAGGSTRQTRSLVFPDTSRKERLVMISGSLVGGKPDRVLAPNGVAIADTYRGIRVLKYRTTQVVAELEPDRSELMKPGVRARAWSRDSRVLAISGDGWVGAWMPFEAQSPVFLNAMSSVGRIDVLAAFNDPTRVLCAHESKVHLLEVSGPPLRQTPRTKFEDFVSRVPEPSDTPRFDARRDWKRGFTQWGHEAVHTLEDSQLVWYSVSGGRDDGAGVQTFESFLRDGPQGGSPPGPILVEIVQAVRILTREKR